MANNPTLLKKILAVDGEKNTIPETTAATTGLFSEQYGFQSINALPLTAGGKAPQREDFNGAFNLLGGVAFYAQKGFTFKWSADQDYYAGCVVIDDTDGLRYECIADVTANNTAPSADATHWQIFSAGTDLDAWFRQPSTQYNNGDVALLLNLPTGWYLECTGTGGITSASDLVITSPTVGGTVTDGAVIWTIRAVASTADIPAPVDISGKANIDLDNLSAAGEAKISNIPLTSDFTIIYPNGGTESNPANITNNNRYLESNPYPGYYVTCLVEFLISNEWGDPGGWVYGQGSSGTNASQFNDDSIAVVTGTVTVFANRSYTGNAFGINQQFTSLPARVKVWKIGKIPT